MQLTNKARILYTRQLSLLQIECSVFHKPHITEKNGDYIFQFTRLLMLRKQDGLEMGVGGGWICLVGHRGIYFLNRGTARSDRLSVLMCCS